MYTEAICLTSGTNKLFEKDKTLQVSVSSAQLRHCGAEAVDTVNGVRLCQPRLFVTADGEVTLARRL